MGPLFALVAACMVAVALSSDSDSSYPPRRPSGYGQHPQGYGNDPYPPPPRRNLYNELAEAKARVAILAANDNRLNGDLDDAEYKINAASEFRVKFLEEIYPYIQSSMKEQDARIADLTATLKDQMTIIDEVNQLSSRVQSLLTHIREARDNHRQIIGDLIGLANTEREQRIAISNITAEATIQNLRLDEAEGNIEHNEMAGRLIYDKLIEVVEVVNNERAEVFYFDIDNTAPVEVTFSRPVTTDVYYNIAIKGYHVEGVPHDGYGNTQYGKSYSDESIAQSLTVESRSEYDQIQGATITAAYDDNVGWGRVKYVACLVAYYIDNSHIQNIDETGGVFIP